MTDKSIEAVRTMYREANPLTSSFVVDNCLGEAYAVTTLGFNMISMDVDHCLSTLCHLDNSEMFDIAYSMFIEGNLIMYTKSSLAKKELEELFELCDKIK